MEVELSDAEKQLIEKARLYLGFWKWWRWVQAAIGIFFILWAASMSAVPADAASSCAFGIFHPLVLGTFGLIAIMEAAKNQKTQDRRLLVKFGRAHGVAIH